MTSISPCSLQEYLRIVPAKHTDYEQLKHFHYQGSALGPTRAIYKLIDDHPWRALEAPVVGVIVYGSPPANLAGRNAATGGVFAGLGRSAALSLLNERMVCIRRVIIEPRYRGLGLASRLVAETMPLTGAAMVEAVSVMGRMHPFFKPRGCRRSPHNPTPKPNAWPQRWNRSGSVSIYGTTVPLFTRKSNHLTVDPDYSLTMKWSDFAKSSRTGMGCRILYSGRALS